MARKHSRRKQFAARMAPGFPRGAAPVVLKVILDHG